MKKFLLPFLFILFCQNIFGQTNYKFKNDIGINVTSLLSKVISLADDKETPTIGILYRRKSDRQGFVFGAGFNVFEDQFFTNSANINVNNQDFSVRLGFEKYKKITNKFILSYGVQALSENILVKTDESFFGNNTFTSNFTSERTNNIGVGPSLKFEYMITQNLSISTESNLLAILQFEENIIQDASGITKLRYKRFKATSNIPSILYLNVHF